MNVKKILVPVTGDEAGEEAFRLACELAKESKAKLYARYVIEVGQNLPVDAEVDPTEAGQAESILDRIEAVAHAEKCQVDANCRQARNAGPAIVEESVDMEVGLIVLGIPDRRRFGQFTLGETAYYVLKNAPCPVILWREQTRGTSIGES